MKINLFIRNIEHSGCTLFTIIHEDIVEVITIMICIEGYLMEDIHIMGGMVDMDIHIMGGMVGMDIHISPRVAISPIIEDPTSVQHSVFY